MRLYGIDLNESQNSTGWSRGNMRCWVLILASHSYTILLEVLYSSNQFLQECARITPILRSSSFVANLFWMNIYQSSYSPELCSPDTHGIVKGHREIDKHSDMLAVIFTFTCVVEVTLADGLL
jgi:hypothetical protein